VPLSNFIESTSSALGLSMLDELLSTPTLSPPSAPPLPHGLATPSPPPLPAPPPAAQIAAQISAAASTLSDILATEESITAEDANQVTQFMSSLIEVQGATRRSADETGDIETSEQAEAAAESLNQAVLQLASTASQSSNSSSGAISLHSPNLNMTAERRQASDLAASALTVDVTGSEAPAEVQLPSTILGAVTGADVSLPISVVLYTMPQNMHGPPRGSPALGVQESATVSFSLVQSGVELQVSGAREPINVSVPFQRPNASMQAAPPCLGDSMNGANASSLQCSSIIECRWWNASLSDWSTAGCTTTAQPDETFTCSCNHLTEFIVFEFPTSGDELLEVALSSIRMNDLSDRAFECARNPSRTWRTLPAIWGCELLLLGLYILLLGHAIHKDRRDIHDILMLLAGKKQEEERKRVLRRQQSSMRRRRLSQRFQPRLPSLPLGRKSSSVSMLPSQSHVSRIVSSPRRMEAPPPSREVFRSVFRAVYRAKMAQQIAPRQGHDDGLPPRAARRAHSTFVLPSPRASITRASACAPTTPSPPASPAAPPMPHETFNSNIHKLDGVHGMQDSEARQDLDVHDLISEEDQDGMDSSSATVVPAPITVKHDSATSSIVTMTRTTTSTITDTVTKAKTGCELAAAQPDGTPRRMVCEAHERSAPKPILDGVAMRTLPNASMARWKQARATTQRISQVDTITKRWHKDVDSVWKRLLLACTMNHTLCAGILYRGSPGYTRAQTVMILVNSFAFELIMLCLFYEVPEPEPFGNMTDGTAAEAEPAMVINPVVIIISSVFAALICIPTMLTFAWLYEPMIFVRLSRWMLRVTLCWPFWLCATFSCNRTRAQVASDPTMSEGPNDEAIAPSVPAEKLPLPVMLPASPAPSPPDGDAMTTEVSPLSKELPSQRSFSYESLNEVLLKASLTRSWKRKDWPAVRKILFGWACNHLLFFTMLWVFLLYGCEIFEPNLESIVETRRRLARGGGGAGATAGTASRDDTGPALRVAGNTDELLIAWVLSAFQRFVLHEPTLILAQKGLPMLFASAFCANCCGETIVNSLSLFFEAVMAVVKEIRG